MKDLEDLLTFPCFVDSNIWLYAFIDAQNEGKKSKIAQSVLLGDDIRLSTQIINEVCVNLIKKTIFTESEIEQLIISIYNRYSVTELTKKILISASKIRATACFSFWDSIVAASALDHEAQYLLTEDMQHGFVIEESVTIINPFRPST